MEERKEAERLMEGSEGRKEEKGNGERKGKKGGKEGEVD